MAKKDKLQIIIPVNKVDGKAGMSHLWTNTKRRIETKGVAHKGIKELGTKGHDGSSMAGSDYDVTLGVRVDKRK